MIHNIVQRSDLLSFARKQADDCETRSVKPSEVDDVTKEGWSVVKVGKTSVKIQKPKKRHAHLESRVWTLLYKMGFAFMSAKGGAYLSATKDPESPKTQVDVVAIDDDIALLIECKSFERPQKDPQFHEKMAKLMGQRKSFTDSVRSQFKAKSKRYCTCVMFTWDLILTDSNRDRADQEGLILFDEHDLTYFEALAQHLGPAARYQLLREVARGRHIPGLEIRVPALQTKMGDYTCYNFSIRPDYLLKIAFVAHRSKAKAIDVDAYQRMVSKSRLQKIREYITEDGIFPTNIVINFEDKKNIRFELSRQEGTDEGGRVGWLTLTPSYGTAWIIDGQHRLFAYSGHARAHSSYINVLAFEGLTESKQAQLFVDINSEQKRVKRSLLVELNAALKWNAPEEEKRIAAIISRVGLALDEELDSPLRHRVLLADVKRTDVRCISLTSIVTALDKPGFYIVEKKQGVKEYGPLFREDNKATLIRTLKVLKTWFGTIAEDAKEWWELGSAEGGGLSMNNGITVCINVLRSVFEHLRANISNIRMLDDSELREVVEKYAHALGSHFAGLSAERRAEFRSLQGVDGQNTGTRECQQALRNAFPDFNPPGLDDWIAVRKANTNEKATDLVDMIELQLQEHIVNTLKAEFGTVDDKWWFDGIPLAVRKKVDERINEAGGGIREHNFDLIHYREIALHNWELFQDALGMGKSSSAKTKRTQWISDVGAIRNTVKHPSRREYVSFEQLRQLEETAKWLDAQLSNLP